MKKIPVAKGIYWVEIPEAGLSILCGCPADSVKHLMKRGLIVPVEKKGVRYETGPNAILLSDKAVQNGDFSNLSEFPILQMLYRQGMIIPGHPGNNGTKPMLIGLAETIRQQAQYLFRGNYGLASVEELVEAGMSRKEAEEMMRLKLRFAFDRIARTEDLVDIRVVDFGFVELRNGVMLTRKGLNIYEIKYRDETVTVNLNLEAGERYEPAYTLSAHRVRPEYFSVAHIGEGDGWDAQRPCMSSLLTYQGHVYLIDAGPNVEYALTALGISINEIEGVFLSHVHDDHFAGLTSLIRSDRKIKFFSIPVVRATVQKKMAAIMGLEENMFSRFFEIVDLRTGEWNDIDGLEVKPVISPHPVETSIFFFRTLWGDGYKTYAHLADIISLELLERMITYDSTRSGVTRKYYEHIRNEYLTPVDLKKLDNGGGMIHGRADDFKVDRSRKIILSHTSSELSNAHKEIGSNAIFGTEDVLIPTRQDYYMRGASDFLTLHFPQVPRHQLLILLNCPVSTYNAGSILLRKGDYPKSVFLTISGVLDYIDSERKASYRLSVGSIIGQYEVLNREPSPGTYRAASYLDVLEIPGELFINFVNRNALLDEIIETYLNASLLKRCRLFEEMVSDVTLNRIAREMKRKCYRKGEILPRGQEPELVILETGELVIEHEQSTLKLSSPGAYFGEETIITGKLSSYRVSAVTDCSVMVIPASVLMGIPVVQWKLLETLDIRRHFPPAAPSELAATVFNQRVALTWKDNSNNETGFKILRRRRGETDFRLVATVMADITYFGFEIDDDQVYEYCVVSVNEAGESSPSNIVEVSPALRDEIEAE